jgi:hypothetical protein
MRCELWPTVARLRHQERGLIAVAKDGGFAPIIRRFPVQL